MTEAGAASQRRRGGQVRRAIASFAVWALPLTVIFEWVGGTFYKSMSVRVAYLALFLAAFVWGEPAETREAPALRARWLLGLPCVALGLAMFAYAAWWLMGARLGLGPFVPPPALANEASRLLLPLLAAWPLAIGAGLCLDGRLGARAYQRLGAFLALGFVLHFAAQVRVQGLPVANAGPRTFALLGLALLALALFARGSFAVRFAGLLAAGLALRAFGLASWQIDPRVRDMLALIQSAQDRFVAGEHPYALYAMQHGSTLPLTYLPGLWLGYGLPRLVGLDLRWFAPLAELGVFSAFAWTASRVAPVRRAWAQAIVFTFACAWFFSPSVQWNAIYAEPSWWWALLGATLLFSFAGPHWLGALCLGVAIGTRHFAIVLAPFVLLYFVRLRGWRGSLPWLAIVGATASALLFPFAATRPELFWFGTVRWLREYGPAHLSWFLDRFSFTQWFVEHQAIERLPYAQAGVVAVCLLAAAWVRQPRWIASFAATASLLFIMLNILVWDSFLLDGAMSAAALVVTAPLRARERGQGNRARREPSRTFYASLAALVLTVLAAGYLGFTLIGTLRPRGGQAAHDFLVKAVRPGDLVIDRSDRRLQFVAGSWLLRREEVPAPIGGEFYDPAWRGESALTAAGRVWLISQSRRDDALRAELAQLGTLAEDRSYGDYRVQALVPRRAQPSEFTVRGASSRTRVCALGWNRRNLRAVVVSRAAPVTLELPPGAGRLLLAAGFPNELVVWPHVSARAQHGAQALTIENLHGISFASFAPATNTLELVTDDPEPRELCVELSRLEP